MKLLLLSAFCIVSLGTTQLRSQNNTDNIPIPHKVGGADMSIGLGTALLSENAFAGINKNLQKNNFALIPNQYMTWGVDIRGMFKNTVFSMGFAGTMKRNTVSDSSKTTVSGTLFNISLGRVIYHTDKVLLYPMVGADFGSFNVHSHYTGANMASDISGDNSYHSLNVSLNLDYLFNGTGDKVDWKSNNPKIKPTGTLSLSVGYSFSPVNTYWNDSNYDISNRYNANVNYPANVIGSLTASNFSMFYATVKIGFGAFAKR